MWELYTNINGKPGEMQKFSSFKEGRKAFRKAVKQAFDENPELLEHFIAQIDGYCDKYFPAKKRAKKPVPYSFARLKSVLRNYVTNTAYNINPDVFFVSGHRDKNMEICFVDLYEINGDISLFTKVIKRKKGKPLMFPKIYIPLRFEDDEFGNVFSITDDPGDLNAQLPDTHSVWVRLAPEDNSEYFEEEDDEDEEEDNEDKAEDDDEEAEGK